MSAKTAKIPAKAYVAYYRVSTARQGESGLGLEAQQSAVERFLVSVKGTLAGAYTEIESGKKHTNRPQLAAAIAAAKRLKAVLVIAKLDRLARNVAFISNLMESAAEFTACDMPQANKLTLHIMAAMAEHEARAISERTVAALQAAKARGVKLGNPRLDEARKRAVQARRKPPTLAHIKEILGRYRAEGLSLRAAAEKLNELGVKTPAGGAWHSESVRRALG